MLNAALAALIAALWFTAPAFAELQQRLAQAGPGSVIMLAPGVYSGTIVIDKPLRLIGGPGVILDGQGQGSVITVRAPNVTLRGLTIRRSGHDLTAMNAGVFAERTANNILIEDNTLALNAFGVWLDGCLDARVINNRISGDTARRSQDRGNGIHLFNTRGADIAGNQIWDTRDGIYIDSSNGNALRDNRIRDLRYGIHYMYSYDNEVSGNLTRYTRTGYALMQSKNLRVVGNRSEFDQNYGFLLNFITDSTLRDNVVIDVQSGSAVSGAEGKALFIYNSQYNRIVDNRFARAEIGIHLTAGSEDNQLYGNAFIDNRVQVKYVASRTQEWSRDGRGNYWSNYLGWDLNGDGIGDQPFEPNDAVDLLLWRYPTAKTLFNSPAVASLRWAQQQFPVLRPQGVRDSAPLMRPDTPGTSAQ